MRLCFIGNAGTIVRDGNKDKIPLLFPLDTDIGTYRRIFYRVIDDIDEYLDDKPHIDLNQNVFIRFADDQMVVRAFAVDMAQRLCNYFIHEFCGHMQVHTPFFQPADGQKIFHQIDQPHRVIVYVRIHLFFGLCVKQLAIGKKIACIPRYGGEGCTQIVGFLLYNSDAAEEKRGVEFGCIGLYQIKKKR